MNEEAAQSFRQGVEVAQKILSNPSDTDHALTTIGDLLLAEADCYLRMDKIDDAVSSLQQGSRRLSSPIHGPLSRMQRA